MKSYLVFVGLLLCIPLFDASSLQPGYRYFENINASLKLHIIPTTWNNAVLQCEIEGGTLASPVTPMVLKAMVTVMESQSVNRPIFTGIHATFAKGVFNSIQGVPIEEIPIIWAPNEPDNFENNEECLTMDQNGYLADVKCSGLHPFMCYKEIEHSLVHSESLDICGNAGYNFESRTGSCYKFEPVGVTWERAFMTCAVEGGHLAIINSDEESQVLVDLFRKYPNKDIKSEYYTDSAFIGFHDWGVHESWKTIHGETFEKAGYGTWSAGQPNNYKTRETGYRGQYCGSFYRGGGLEDMWCFIRLPYICEKKPLRIPEPTTTPVKEESSTTDSYNSYISTEISRQTTPVDIGPDDWYVDENSTAAS